MLIKICDYIRRHHVVSNQQIAREFNIDIQALQPMLDWCLRQGIVIVWQKQASCKKSCFKCNPPALLYYQVGRKI